MNQLPSAAADTPGDSALSAFVGSPASCEAGRERVRASSDSVCGTARGILFLILMGLIALQIACASGGARFPYPACLYNDAGLYDTGRAIAKRETDDAVLFQFNDATKGDLGFQWVKPGGNRSIRPCREATLMDADNPARRAAEMSGVVPIAEGAR